MINRKRQSRPTFSFSPEPSGAKPAVRKQRTLDRACCAANSMTHRSAHGASCACICRSRAVCRTANRRRCIPGGSLSRAAASCRLPSGPSHSTSHCCTARPTGLLVRNAPLKELQLPFNCQLIAMTRWAGCVFTQRRLHNHFNNFTTCRTVASDSWGSQLGSQKRGKKHSAATLRHQP